MSSGLFPYWLKLSLYKIVRDAACEAVEGILVETEGYRPSANGNHEEWVRVHVFSSRSDSEKEDEWIGEVMLQVSCFARYAEDRRDRKMNRPSEIAGLISQRIGKRHHQVLNYNEDSPVEKGGVLLRSPKNIHLDESELAQTGGSLDMPANIHSEVMTFPGSAYLK